MKNRTCALYRHFDADGRLLYVGITVSIPDRLAQHARNSAWVEQIVAVAVEWFPSVEAALGAERAAIRAERPLFNKRRPRVLPPIDVRKEIALRLEAVRSISDPSLSREERAERIERARALDGWI